MDGTPTPPPVTCEELALPEALLRDPAIADLDIRFAGPPLSEGAMPLVVYLALCSEESLCLDPFNQPVAFLKGAPLRVASLTLPGHGPGFDKVNAMSYWAERMSAGADILTTFVAAAKRVVDTLITLGVTEAGSIAVAGLSRGAFVGFHLAAEVDAVSTVCGFAPLTSLQPLHEFAPVVATPAFAHYNLNDKAAALAGKAIRLYMGNRDTRVGTRACYEWAERLTEAAFAAGYRSPPVELTLYPSIGHKGHGTPPAIFYDGAQWLQQHLLQQKGS